ncbi:GDP-L-fucose synthase [Candidatus Dependentiae bacterium]|nr:GDP-L-fucose synthase [Candidatus Dependentiae bacterium]
MHLNEKIYIAGHEGLVGSAIVRLLKARGFQHLITRTKDELDLRAQKDVNNFFLEKKPDFVFLAAALVGGIKANNDYPASFLYDNLMIQANVMHAAHLSGVKKLLFLGSSCIYPRMCEQPIKEKYLMTGPLEMTNEAYAIAKISGIKLAQAYRQQYGSNFICAMPTNLYGPGDTFDKERSHVIPALILKIHEAKEKNIPSIPLWGTGNALREFLHADDLAAALFILMEHYNESEIINIGSGQEVSVLALSQMISEIINYRGSILFNNAESDGTPRKILDSSRIGTLGWQAKINLRKGLEQAYEWYLENKKGTATWFDTISYRVRNHSPRAD